MTNPNKVISWDLTVRWSDTPHEVESVDEIPDHIVRDIQYFFDTLEEERENDER
jgi:hypothetical protein